MTREAIRVAPGALADALARVADGASLQLTLLAGRHRTGQRIQGSVRIFAEQGVELIPPRIPGSCFRIMKPAAGPPPLVELEGLQFSGGLAWKGAAVQVLSGQLKMKTCSFTGLRTLAEGAAIWVAGGSELWLSDCRFEGGRALAGGAVYIAPGARIMAEDCSFIRNRGRCGGALALEAARGDIQRCYFDGNEVANCGPALAGRGLGSASAREISLGPNQVRPALESEDAFFSLVKTVIN